MKIKLGTLKRLIREAVSSKVDDSELSYYVSTAISTLDEEHVSLETIDEYDLHHIASDLGDSWTFSGGNFSTDLYDRLTDDNVGTLRSLVQKELQDNGLTLNADLVVDFIMDALSCASENADADADADDADADSEVNDGNMLSIELDVVDDVKESLALARDAGCTATKGGVGGGGHPTIIVTGLEKNLRRYLDVYTGGDGEAVEEFLSMATPA